jgi:hypothetical protein
MEDARMNWETWKKGFDAWEKPTAQYLDHWLRSPALLQPLGGLFTRGFKVKAAADKATEAVWSLWGLPTKRDQERTLHLLNQLQSRLLDLEDKLTDLEKPERRA